MFHAIKQFFRRDVPLSGQEEMEDRRVFEREALPGAEEGRKAAVTLSLIFYC